MEKKETDTYLEMLIDKATPKWQDLDPDQWLRTIRGNYSLPNKSSTGRNSSV